jgi:hypothetical protein
MNLASSKGFWPSRRGSYLRITHQPLFGSLQSNLATPLNLKLPLQGQTTRMSLELVGQFLKLSKQKSASGNTKTGSVKQILQ